MKKIILSAAFLVLISGAAMAQTAPAAQHGPFGGDNGGKGITKAQFIAKAQARAEQMFAKIDTNGDGVITRDEMKAARAMMKAQRGNRGQRGGEGGAAGENNGGNQFP